MEQVKETFKKADCVCFDVDSTVCVDEGADELAAFMGVGEQVAALLVFETDLENTIPYSFRVF